MKNLSISYPPTNISTDPSIHKYQDGQTEFGFPVKEK